MIENVKSAPIHEKPVGESSSLTFYFSLLRRSVRSGTSPPGRSRQRDFPSPTGTHDVTSTSNSDRRCHARAGSGAPQRVGGLALSVSGRSGRHAATITPTYVRPGRSGSNLVLSMTVCRRQHRAFSREPSSVSRLCPVSTAAYLALAVHTARTSSPLPSPPASVCREQFGPQREQKYWRTLDAAISLLEQSVYEAKRVQSSITLGVADLERLPGFSSIHYEALGWSIPAPAPR